MMYLFKHICLLGALFHCVTLGKAEYKCYRPWSTGIIKDDCVAAINSFRDTNGKFVPNDTVLEAKKGTCEVILGAKESSKNIVTTKSGALSALDQVFTLCGGYGTVTITKQDAYESAVELYAGIPTN
ncbi:hypothetical protein DFH28DRAFT_511387 [Melampsora americana]|nr:hypothetical protein DFH28DRAFT_511387 [Melampsora americana]